MSAVFQMLQLRDLNRPIEADYLDQSKKCLVYPEWQIRKGSDRPPNIDVGVLFARSGCTRKNDSLTFPIGLPERARIARCRVLGMGDIAANGFVSPYRMSIAVLK